MQIYKLFSIPQKNSCVFFCLPCNKKSFIESTSKCKFVAKLGKMFEKDLIWGKEI